MTLSWKSLAYSHPCLCRFNQDRYSRLLIPKEFQRTIFSTGALCDGGQIYIRWKSVGVGIYWVTLPLQLPLLVPIYPGLNLIGIFIYDNTNLLIEIHFDMHKVFYAGLEKIPLDSVTVFPVAQSLEKLPWSGQSHINYWVEYLPIYRNED